MDEETFVSELLEALKRPEEWDNQYSWYQVTHQRTGISVHIGSQHNFMSGYPDFARVYTRDGVEMPRIPVAPARDCYRAVRRRVEEETEFLLRCRREQFLTNFEGFNDD